MELYVQYMESRCENGLVVREEKDGWCLGDWCAPERVRLPEPFVNTSMFVRYLRMLCTCGRTLGKDVSAYCALIDLHTKAITDAYRQGDSFLSGDQGADAFALDCGIEDSHLLCSLIERYAAMECLDTGIFGTDILARVLFANGQEELAVRLLGGEGEVSFGHMRKSGATTLWENWNGEASHNHPMFGAAVVTLFRYLLGIDQPQDSTAFRKLQLHPVFPQSLQFARGYVTIPQGKVSVSWEREGDTVTLQVCIPDGTDAVISVPGAEQKLHAGETTLRIHTA